MEAMSGVEGYRAFKDRLGEDEAHLLIRDSDTPLREQVAPNADLELGRITLEHQLESGKVLLT